MISFVHNFIDDDKKRTLLVQSPKALSQGVLIKMYVDDGRCVFTHTAVRSVDGKELVTDKEKMEVVKFFSEVSIDTMECLVRFDRRFDVWLTGQAEFRSLQINDGITKTTLIGE